jgi:nucleoid-associated protein YgaU
VDLELQESEPIKAQLVKSAKNSPDHAKVYTVQRGDTLQSISFREYDDPAEWRRIADANSVDDPMALEPGMKLLVPPILK